MPHLEITEGILVFRNIFNKDYQLDLKVLYAFVPDKSFGQLIAVCPKNVIFWETFNSQFSYIELWFTEKSSKPLEIEDKISITLLLSSHNNF